MPAPQESWRQARSELESFLKEQPENWQLIDVLALTNMGLGDKAAAFGLLERAMAAMPVEKDALDGPVVIETLARVAAQMGEPDRAISALRRAISLPTRTQPPFTACAAPPRSHVGSAARRSAISRTVQGETAVNRRNFSGKCAHYFSACRNQKTLISRSVSPTKIQTKLSTNANIQLNNQTSAWNSKSKKSSVV